MEITLKHLTDYIFGKHDKSESFVVYGKDYQKVLDELQDKTARPKYIIRGKDDEPYKGVHAITLKEYKKKRKNEAILLSVFPDGYDGRNCVKEILNIYSELGDGIEIYADDKTAALPVDRLEELKTKPFFMTRKWIEIELLQENPEAKVNVLIDEYGITEEIAREAEMFIYRQTQGLQSFEDVEFVDSSEKTIYIFGASQIKFLLESEGVMERLRNVADKNKYRLSLTLREAQYIFNDANLIMSISFKPGDRVMLMLDPVRLVYAPSRKDIPEVIIYLSKFLEERGVKLLCYTFPLMQKTGKKSPYEEIIPLTEYALALRTQLKTANERKAEDDYIQYEQLFLSRRNYITANGVRFFINESLNKTDNFVFLNANHYTKSGNKLLEEEIFEILEKSDFLDEDYNKKIYETTKAAQELFYSTTLPYRFKGVNEYTKDLTNYKKPGKSGGIVMNCNPVTNGHMYLIKTVAEQVDNLFIFVVEEDRSEFPFEERIELVKENCKDIENVTVLPSGKFIISQLTFPEYFRKSEMTALNAKQKASVTSDVTLFAVKIAPALNITIRFAGEEPLDPITREYNRVMSNLLPFYGVEFVEIKRKEEDGEVISASRVRKLLHENNFEGIKPLVPEATFRYLEKRNGNMV
ncbi:MAG: adenylyltransferase/cytidyltransferase family protein [Ruminococcus sp.]|nr:adenylyltransferase/cytidyltransferase family protein [Ruminococcus sp.]